MVLVRLSTLVSATLAMSSLMLLYATYDFLTRHGTASPESPAPVAVAAASRDVRQSKPLTTPESKPAWERQPSWSEFYEFVESTTRCENLEIFGGFTKDEKRSDGAKAACLDKGLAPSPGNCLVLSFGINNEWSFDDAMDRYGCTVYAFDPTMNKPAHKRGKSIYFLPLGLGSRRETVNYRKKTFEVLSYREILDTIEKTDSIIDYLKIDIEGYEMDFFSNILKDDVELLNNIKQIGMEIHIAKRGKTKDQLWLYIHQLLELNFTPVFSEPNTFGGNPFTHMGKKVSACYEIVWANKNFV